MQVCTSLQTDNHASTTPLNFLQAECPSCRPTNSVKAWRQSSLIKQTTKRKSNFCYHSMHSVLPHLLWQKSLSKVVLMFMFSLEWWPPANLIVIVTTAAVPLTHTHPFNGPLSRTTWVSRYQRGKTNLDFTEAKRQWVAVASAGPYATLHLAPDR